MRRYAMYLMMLFTFSIGAMVLNAKISIKDLGDVGEAYELDFEADYAVLSRDGSKAFQVQDGHVVTKPGRYYLNIWSSQEEQEMICFRTSPQDSLKTHYIINTPTDFEEAFKTILENYQEEVTLQLKYGDFNINTLNELLFKHIEATRANYPTLTFEKYKISTRNTYKPKVYMSIKYPKHPLELKEYEKLSYEKIHTMIQDTLTEDMSLIEREWHIYKALIEHAEYSKEVINQIAPPMTHTMQGTLVDGIGVCDGYAKALMYLLNATGIPTTFISGEAGRQLHAWNQVYLDDEVYHIDATWGDQSVYQLGVLYDYFNENDLFMKKTHKWETDQYPSSTSNTYLGGYNQLNIEGVYSIPHPNALWGVLNEIKKDSYESGTVILNNTHRYNWKEEEVIGKLTRKLNASIHYQIKNKYNYKVIHYDLLP